MAQLAFVIQRGERYWRFVDDGSESWVSVEQATKFYDQESAEQANRFLVGLAYSFLTTIVPIIVPALRISDPSVPAIDHAAFLAERALQIQETGHAEGDD